MCIYIYLSTIKYMYKYIYISYPTEWGPSLLAKLVQITIITIVYDTHIIGLVIWNMNFIFPFSWEFHHPN